LTDAPREIGHVRGPIWTAFAPYLLLLLMLRVGAASAAQPQDEAGSSPETSPKTTAPVLLVLKTAPTPKGASREERFVKELGIVLDGVTIRMERPANPEFGTLALGEQIEHVRSLIAKHGAVAATWLTEVSPDLLLQHLVVISTGRALVRLIEIRAKTGFEADLALAARELLGTAFLFDQPPGPATDPVGRVVESVREQAAPPPTVVAPPPSDLSPPGNWMIGAELRLEGGVVGHAGPSLLLGGALMLERRMVAGLCGRLSIGVSGGPFGARADDEEIQELVFQTGLGLGYLFDLGRVSLGPVLEAQTANTKVTTKIEGGSEQVFRSWRVRAGAFLDMRVHLSSRADLLLDAGITGTPMQDVYFTEISRETMFASPHLSWEGRLGLVVQLGSAQP